MDYLQRSIQGLDQGVEFLLKYQITDPNDSDFGGYYYMGYGLVAPNCGASAAGAIEAYFCPGSRYYRDSKVLQCADGLLQHLRGQLHEDGTVDNFTCNFHSAPDNAFVVVAIAEAALMVDAQTEAEKEFEERLLDTLRRMGEGLVYGGFHTPNHRWMISAALALINTLSPDPRYISRINEYLAEHIDCNEDGELAERSTGSYNEINNHALLIMARHLNMPELLEHVRRNLTLMRAFIHSDCSIFTENSVRQDKGTVPYAERYAYQYLLCGHALKDREMQSIGVLLLEDCVKNGRPFPLSIHDQLLYPEAFNNLPDPADKNVFMVDRLLKGSGLLRLSRGGMNLWVVEKLPIFLFLKKNNIDFYIKGGINFFNCRHLLVEDIHEGGDGSYEMNYKGEGCYLQPFGEYQGTADWWQMDRSKRKTSGHLEITVTINIKPMENGFDVRVRTEGCPGSTIRLEIGVKPNVLVRGEGYHIPATAGGKLIAQKGELTLFDGADTVSIGPAFAANDIVSGLFGAVPPSDGRFNIFFNDVTNFDHTFSIRAK